MLKKILLTLSMCVSLITFASVSVQAQTIDMQDPYKMVTEVANKTFNEIKNNKDKLSNINFRKKLVREELMPYVDYKFAAYKVIGNQLKNTSKEERDAFAEAFAEYIVTSYAEVLGKYTDQELVPPVYKQVSPADKQVNAKFFIREAGKQDLEVIFVLRKNTKNGEWKAFDMVAENISMLSAKQSELAPMIRNQGISKVTEILKEHNEKGSSELSDKSE